MTEKSLLIMCAFHFSLFGGWLFPWNCSWLIEFVHYFCNLLKICNIFHSKRTQTAPEHVSIWKKFLRKNFDSLSVRIRTYFYLMAITTFMKFLLIFWYKSNCERYGVNSCSISIEHVKWLFFAKICPLGSLCTSD